MFRLFILSYSILIFSFFNFGETLLQTYKLQNGLTVILSPIKNIQSVCVFTYIKTGVRDDPVELKGISTIFKNIRLNAATKNFNYLEGLFSTRRKGGIVGSKVEYDYSFFYQVVQAEDLNIALMLESERFKSLRFNNKILQNHKNRHLQKLINLIKYNAYYNSYLWVNSKLFANSIYQYPLMGEPNRINKISIDDVQAVYDRYSDPNLATLVIVGDFETIEVKIKIKKYFSNVILRNENKHKYKPLNLKHEYGTKTGVIKNITKNYVIFGIQAPSVLSYNYTSFLFMKYFLFDKRMGNIKNYLKNANDLDISIDHRMSDNIELNSLIIGISSKKKINIVKTRYLLLNYFRKLPLLMLKKKTEIKNIKYLMEIRLFKNSF